MNKLVLTVAVVCFSVPAVAASITNKDDVARKVVITEGGNQTELVLDPGEAQSICNGGCFVTMPNGDREALSGSETIEISGGRAEFK